MDNIEDYFIEMDSDCLHQDFDDYDLYGERLVEDSDDNFGDDLSLE